MIEVVVWVVGQWKQCECNSSWEIAGIYTEHGKAVAACKTSNHFIGPIRLNNPLPDETTEWPGCYYPLAESVDG